MKKTLSFIILLLLISACSSNETTNLETEEPNQQDELLVETAEDKNEDFSILITTDILRIRTSPNTNDNENIVGYAYMGEVYTVHEQTKDDNYSWYKIDDNKWVANDGSWCAAFKSEGKDEYPYVMLDNERLELLTKINLNCFTSDSYEDVFVCLNIFSDKGITSSLACDIYLGLYDGTNTYPNQYKYNITYAVKVDDNTYELYVEPIEYEGLIDNSTGCLRISNIHDVANEQEPEIKYRHFDMIFIKNKNSIENSNFDKLYGVTADYVHSGQVSL